MIFKKYHIPKKAVSVLLALVVLISTLAIISSISFSASALTVNGNREMLSTSQASWKIHKISDSSFKLQNVETGLFMTMLTDNGNYSLILDNDRGDSDNAQSFRFLYSGYTNANNIHYFIIIHNSTNRCIYAGDNAESILFGNASNWWNQFPTGASSNSNCQFIAEGIAEKAVADGEIATFKSANGMYLQVNALRKNIKYDVGAFSLDTDGSDNSSEALGENDIVFSKTQYSVEGATWTLHSVTGGYLLENKKTGLYMTMESQGSNYKLVQSAYQDSDNSQIFGFIVYGNYYILKHISTNRVIYSNTAGDGVLFQDASNWWTAPSGTDNNNKCQFQLATAPADKVEVVICNAVNRAYLQCNQVTSNEDEDLEIDKDKEWKFEFEEEYTRNDGKSAARYKIKNELTGLYLNSNGNNEAVTQMLSSDNDNQIWQVVLHDGRWTLIDNGGRVLYYNAEKNDWFVNSGLDISDTTATFNNELTQNQLPSDDSIHQLIAKDYIKEVSVYSEFTGFADVVYEEEGNVQKYAVGFSANGHVSEDATKWVLHSFNSGFKLRNMETGLYLTIDVTTQTLVQTVESNDTAQCWQFVAYNGNYLLKSVKANQVIYASSSKIGFKDYDSWWTPPADFASANNCQFGVSFKGSPVEGCVTSFTVLDNSRAVMCSVVSKTEVESYPLASTDNLLFTKVDGVQWEAKKVGDAFNIINRYTGLYLTKLSDTKVGLKSADGTDEQKWVSADGNKGSYIVNVNEGALNITDKKIYLSDKKNTDSQLFEDLDLTDGKVQMLKTVDGLYLINGFEGFNADVSGKLDNLTISTEIIEKHPVQNWIFEKCETKVNNKTLYKLLNEASGKFLTFTDSGELKESNNNECFNQTFLLVEVQNGYKLLNALGTKELSIEKNGSILMKDKDTGYDSSFVLTDSVKDGLNSTLLSAKEEKYLYTSYWNEDWIDTEYRVYGMKTGNPERQEWEFCLVNASIHSYKIINKSSGMYLTLQGNTLIQDKLRTGDQEKDQIFRLVLQNYYNNKNYYMILSAHNKQLMFDKDIGDKSTASLAEIKNWDKTGGSWDSSWLGNNDVLFLLADGNEAQGYPADGMITSIISNKQHKLEGDAPDASERFVTAVKQANNSDKQRWVLFGVGSNFFIQNKETEQFLTLNTKDRFVQADFTGALNQQWMLKYDTKRASYQLVHASTGLYLGIEANEKNDPAKFVAFNTDILNGNTAWNIVEIVDDQRIELTDGTVPNSYGIYELSVKEPHYILQGELTDSVPQKKTIVISSPETLNSHSITSRLKLKMYAKLTPPALGDKVVWSVPSDPTGEIATIEDYQAFDVDAGDFYGLLNLKDTGKVVVRASLESNPDVFDEWEFNVSPSTIELQSAITQCENLSDGLFTQESYDALMLLVQEARLMLDNVNDLEQKDINIMVEKLNKSLNELEKNPDGVFRKEITVKMTEPIVIQREVFKAAQAEDRIRVYEIMNEKGKLLYSWRFEFDENSDTNYDVALGIENKSENSDIIKLFTGDTKSTILNFLNVGKMPGDTQITYYVGDQYSDDSLLDLYYYNPITSVGDLCKKGIEVVNGYVKLDLETTAEYFLVYAGKKSQEPVDNDDNTDTNNTLDNTDGNPDVYASKISLELIKKAIASTTGDVAAIRLTEPGILTTEMMNELVAANKKLRVEITDSNGNVYLAWLFNGFTDTSKVFDLGWNEKSANEDSIKTLTKAELSQIISFKYEQLPGATAVIIRNSGGFVPGSYLKLFSYDAENGKLVTEQGKAVVSNDGQYLQVVLSNAKEYLVELDTNNKKHLDNANENNNVLLIVLIIAVGAILVGGAVFAIVIIAKKKKSKK